MQKFEYCRKSYLWHAMITNSFQIQMPKKNYITGAEQTRTSLKECHRRESIRSYLNILLKKTWKVTLQQTFMINGMTSISLLMKQYTFINCICIFISQWDVHYYYDFLSQINDLVFRTFDVLSRYNDFYIRRTTYYLILITYHLVITTEYTVRIVCMN